MPDLSYNGVSREEVTGMRFGMVGAVLVCLVGLGSASWAVPAQLPYSGEPRTDAGGLYEGSIEVEVRLNPSPARE